MSENSVVGAEQGGDLLQELLVVGVQRDPPVQHLPADAQLRVAALEELEGEQDTMRMLWQGQLHSAAPPASHPEVLGPLLWCHPIGSPVFPLPCTQLEKLIPDERDLRLEPKEFIESLRLEKATKIPKSNPSPPPMPTDRVPHAHGSGTPPGTMAAWAVCSEGSALLRGFTCPTPARSQRWELQRQEALTEFSRFISTSF